MIEREVLHLLDLQRDPHLVVTVEGEIAHANRAARSLLSLDGAERLPPLTEVAADPSDRLTGFLRNCAATGSPLPGAIRLRNTNGGARLRCSGCALRFGNARRDDLVLLQFRAPDDGGDEFLLLNQKIEELTRESSARRRIEAELRASEQRAAFLSDASRLLSSSLDYEETLANVARSAVPRFADWAAVDLVGSDGELRRVAIEHEDPARVTLVRSLQERYPPDRDAPRGVYHVLRTGVPDFMPDIDDTLLEASAQDDEHLRLLRALQLRSVVIAPLLTKSGALGAISFAFAESGRRHTAEDLATIEDLAARAAVAIENAELMASISEARDRIEEQATELEHQTDELQHQAAVLEEQAVELEAQREAAELSEQFTRSMLDSISDPFVVYDEQWRFRYINEPAAARMAAAGRSDTALIGAVLWDVFPDLAGSRLQREMLRARSENSAATFEEYSSSEGVWFEVRCYPLADGGLATVWKDVSARRRAQIDDRLLGDAGQILASSLDYEATLADLARLIVPSFADWCAIDLTGPDGEIQRVVTHHADPERAAWAERVADDVAPGVHDEWGIGRVIRTGEPVFMPEIDDDALAASAPTPTHLDVWRTMRMRSGMTVPLDAHGRTIGALTLIFSESDRRYDSDDLALARELGRRAALAVDNARLFREASEANRAKSQFLAIMSHELRTPLNAIIGYEDLLEAGIAGPVTETQRTHLGRIRVAAEQLLGLINQILSLARIEAGKEEVLAEDVDLGAIAHETVGLLAPTAEKKELELRYHAPVRDVVVRSDSGKLRQVLLNLLSNAVKFTDRGSVDVTVASDGRSATVSVTDTGVGIEHADMRRIFEPFVQVDASQTRRFGGTGLGLPVSRELARLLGGDITVTSRAGGGSTFTLRLPHTS